VREHSEEDWKQFSRWAEVHAKISGAKMAIPVIAGAASLAKPAPGRKCEAQIDQSDLRS